MSKAYWVTLDVTGAMLLWYKITLEKVETPHFYAKGASGGLESAAVVQGRDRIPGKYLSKDPKLGELDNISEGI